MSQAARQIRSGVCPWCGAGPFQRLDRHTIPVHRVGSPELRRLAGLPPGDRRALSRVWPRTAAPVEPRFPRDWRCDCGRDDGQARLCACGCRTYVCGRCHHRGRHARGEGVPPRKRKYIPKPRQRPVGAAPVCVCDEPRVGVVAVFGATECERCGRPVGEVFAKLRAAWREWLGSRP